MQKRIFKTLVIVMFALQLSAQHTENSPYSRYGIGDLYQSKFLQTYAMGGISMGYRTPNSINFYNPASYSNFDSASFVFETGLNARYLRLSSASGNQRTGGAELSHIACGFRVMKGVGISMGLIPYSKKQYLIKNVQTIDSIGEVSSLFSGSGGINRLYMGVGIQPLKWLSLGANLSYVFGGMNQEKSVLFPASSNFFNSSVINNTNVSDLLFDLGLQTHFVLKKGDKINLGLYYQPLMDINAKKYQLARSFLSTEYSGIVRVKDTIFYDPEQKGEISIPDAISFGLVYERPNKFTIGADMGIQNWSKFSNFGIKDSLQNSMFLAVGTEYIPNAGALKGYLNKIRYRAGFRYNNTFLQLKDNSLSEYGISFGVGLPIRTRFQRYTLLNIGVEYGKRGTQNNGLIEEEFIRGTISFSIYENWFFKRKYD